MSDERVTASAPPKQRIHVLKTWPAPFEALRAERKTFEFRLNDRDFQVGDCLVLQEYNPETDNVTGEAVTRRVVYLLDGGKFGVPPKYCVMSVEPWERASASASVTGTLREVGEMTGGLTLDDRPFPGVMVELTEADCRELGSLIGKRVKISG